MTDGHKLTTLWKQYEDASKADLPQTEASILEKIKAEALEKRLPVDFWDAATKYVNTVQRRDWKQSSALRTALAAEVKDFNEPVITFLWMHEWNNSSQELLWKFLQENPLKGNNPALHRGVGSYLGGSLVQFMDSDQEWAHWFLLQNRFSEEVAASLEKIVEGKYPQEGALKYYLLSRKFNSSADREKKRSALKELQDAYPGTAFALYPESELLGMEMQDLSQKGKSADFQALYAKCKDFEARRAAFTGKEKSVAEPCTSVKYLAERLTAKHLEIRMDQKNITVLFRNLSSASVKLYLGKNVVASWNPQNPTCSFYTLDTLRLSLPVLKDGSYRAEAVNGKTSTSCAFEKYTLSIASSVDADGRKVYVADYNSGKPLAKARILLMKGDVEVASSTMSLKGFTKLPSAFEKVFKAHPRTYYSLVAVSGDRRSRPVGLGTNPAKYVEDKSVKCNIYRDRGAYNPGDVMQFKVILYQGDPMFKMEVCPERKLSVKLYDSEHNLLETKSLKTGSFGSASGEFTLPVGLRNGTFHIDVQEGNTFLDSDYFRVDEFVLPTFDLHFDSRTELYFPGSEVPVSGKVTSYSGHGLSGARVRIKANLRNSTFFEKEMPLEADGVFSFSVPTFDSGFYNAEVTVIDPTGETLSFYDNFYVDDEIGVRVRITNSEDAELSLDGDSFRYRRRNEGRYVVSGTALKAVFQGTDSWGNPVPLDVQYVLLKDGKEVVSKGSAAPGEEVSLPIGQSGLYVLSASVEAKTPAGETVNESSDVSVLALLPGDETLPVSGARLFIGGPSTADTRIEAVLGTSCGDAWVVASVYGKDSELLESRQIKVSDGTMGKVDFDYKESWPDAVRLQLFYFSRGRSFVYDRQYRRSRTKLVLPLEFTRFHDKAYPGTEYTFTLKTDTGVEALAAAWDKSMDAVAHNYWRVVDQRDYSVPYVGVNTACGFVGDNYMDMDGSYYMEEYATTKSMLRMKSGAVLESAALPAMAAEESVQNDFEIADDAGGLEIPSAVRSEFLQALTFQPHLLPQKDGKLSFTFKTSDKLSTYYVRVYAHDQSMRNALAEGEMVVSIPVKVALLEPRFLYEGDVWNASVTVSSVADTPVSGAIALQWDGGCAEIPVTVPAGETVTKVIPVAVPSCHSEQSEESPLTFTAAFVAPEFSDAVRVTVPVYRAAQTLTEAHSAVLHAGQDRDALLAELRSRFVNVPGTIADVREITVLDMVKDAIPSHVDPSGNDVLSLSEAWYVQLIADRLQIPDQVGNDDLSVMPGPDRASGIPDQVGNDDLSVISSGAEGEVEKSQDALLAKIMSCRNSDGGFGWFEGMKSSPVITAALLERFAKLRDRGFTVPDVTSSVKYLDANQFGDVRPYWCGWLSDAQYMHVRALYASVPFTEKAVTEAQKKRLAAFKKDAKSYLTPSAKEGRGLQGQILSKARRLLTLRNLLQNDGGLALARAWGITLAGTTMQKSLKADVASLLEYAVEHRDGGWYYPNAVMPWRGLMESEAYAHALLCDLLSAEGDTSARGKASPSAVADGIRLWLMLQKETQKWDSTPEYIDAITAILDGSKAVLDTKVLALSATCNAPFKDIKAAGNGFTVERHFYLSSRAESRDLLESEIHLGDPVKVGDKIRIVYKIWNGENRSFVKLTAGREASLSPVQQLSGHIGYGFIHPLRSGFVWGFVPQGYRNVKASATEYYFDSYPEEDTELSEEFYVTRAGTFQAPVTVIESLYAPHYRANSQFREALDSSF